MQSEQQIIKEALSNFHGTQNAYARAGIKASDYLGFIWAQNIEQHLWKIINNCTSIGGAISGCNSRAFYDYTCAEPFLSASIRWRLNFLKQQHGFDIEAQPPGLEESTQVDASRRKVVANRQISSDFLNRLMWLERLSQTVP